MNIQTLPVATISLIALNLLVFAFGSLTDSHTWIIRNFGFVPDSVFERNSVDSPRQPHTFRVDSTSLENGATSTLVRLVSSMFIHASAMRSTPGSGRSTRRRPDASARDAQTVADPPRASR